MLPLYTNLFFNKVREGGCTIWDIYFYSIATSSMCKQINDQGLLFWLPMRHSNHRYDLPPSPLYHFSKWNNYTHLSSNFYLLLWTYMILEDRGIWVPQNCFFWDRLTIANTIQNLRRLVIYFLSLFASHHLILDNKESHFQLIIFSYTSTTGLS